METRNDFDRELAHLRKVLEDLPTMPADPGVQKTADQLGKKIEQGADQFGKKIEQGVKQFTDHLQAESTPQRPPEPQYRPTNYRTSHPTNYRTPSYNPPVENRPKQQPVQPYRPKPAAAAPVPDKIPGKNRGTAMQVFGWLGGIPSALICLGGGIGGAVGGSTGALVASGIFGAAMAAFGVMAAVGSTMTRRVKRCQSYRKLFGANKMLSMEQMAQQTGRTQKFLVKDIRDMVRRGMLTNIYFDAGQTCVILNDETYHQYLQLENRRKNLESAKTEASRISSRNDEDIKTLPEEAQNYIKQIRSANDALPSKDISDKLFRLESITIRIYQHIEKHPEKLDQVQRFMDYYMPTTTKLVSAYQEFEAQPVQGTNIKGAKKEIDEMLNTICTAYENMLDGLFADRALDISADISVMETMFRQDGLTEDGLSQPKE